MLVLPRFASHGCSGSTAPLQVGHHSRVWRRPAAGGLLALGVGAAVAGRRCFHTARRSEDAKVREASDIVISCQLCLSSYVDEATGIPKELEAQKPSEAIRLQGFVVLGDPKITAQDSVVERLEHRLLSIGGLPMENLERMNAVRYAPGEYFDKHHDGKFRPLTIFVYLNDLEEEDDAGDTWFPVLGLSFRPRRGEHQLLERAA
eukprot:Skav210857  [mRNA]  locus=scaffold2829:318010:331635:- [translate_table: standard]